VIFFSESLDALGDGAVTHCAIHEKLVKQKRKQLQMRAHTRALQRIQILKYWNTGPKDAGWMFFAGCSQGEVKWAARRCLKDFYYISVLFLRCRGCLLVFPFLVFPVLKREIASAALNGAQHCLHLRLGFSLGFSPSCSSPPVLLHLMPNISAARRII